MRERANAVAVSPGRRHLVADAYLAALAIETGRELVSTDRDFARFPGLRWTLPGDTR